MPVYTVEQLIEKLREFGPKTRVVVDGYEMGFDDLTVSRKIIQRNKDAHPFNGKYDEDSLAKSKFPVFRAVVIGRDMLDGNET